MGILSETAREDIGVECNLLFAESISGVLMNEFPLDAVCASSWRMKSDAQFFYDSDAYQRQLMGLRRDYSRSFAMLVPLVDERMGTVQKQRQLRRTNLKQQTQQLQLQQ